MTGLPISRVIFAIVSCTALIAVIAVAYVLLGRGEEDSGDLSSYHFVASLDIQDASEGDTPYSKLEGWYEPGSGLRWDLSSDDPSLAGMDTQLFADDSKMLYYDGQTNTYTRTPLPEVNARYPGTGFGISLLLGPLPAGSIEEFFDSWTGATWQRTGTEHAFGLDLDVIEVTGSMGGTSTFWIEPRRRFVVRYQSRQVPQTIDARIQTLEFGKNVDDGIFAFDPPPAAIEAPPSSSTGGMSSGPFGGPTVPTQEGFFAVPYVPAGYLTIGGGTTESAGRVSAYRVSLGVGRAPTLFIEQQYRAGGALPSTPAAAIALSVNDHEGFHATVDGEEQLIWSTGDIVVTLRSTTLPFDELMRIADAMHLP
jgi:outer membrane lipoprotein-sorting protein